MTTKEVLNFIEENNVKFIRLGFCDPLGNQKNISIITSQIEEALSTGISFDGSSIKGFSGLNNSDLRLSPDIGTLSLLPWRPNMNSVVRFYCDIKNSNGTNFKNDGRFLLKNTIEDMNKAGFNCEMGTDCEFYLFKTDETGEPTKTTLDNGSFLDISPLDKGENIRREICLCLEQMGLSPKCSYHEKGPGQNQIDFKASNPLTSADNFMTFKTVIKSIASRNGLFASFMPKPFLEKSGNRMNINISLYKDGKNLFNHKNTEYYKYAEWFVAGILDKIEEITIFLNPSNNSYERFGLLEAPQYTSWTEFDRSQLIRIPATQCNEHGKMELTSPDPTVNPYIAFTLILRAGMYGIENKLTLENPINKNIHDMDKKTLSPLKKLPTNLEEAIKKAESSKFVKDCIGSELLEEYISLKKDEYKDFQSTSNKEQYYSDTYFNHL